jgi:predicted polyphosphate/ATP-dependent NAD kinase
MMSQIPVDLLLFAGGDGTARDVYSAIESSIVVLGIPAGVKIHSAVYASNPANAADLASLFIQDRVQRIKLAEVMDIDEDSLRQGIVSAKLYGYLNIPFTRQHVRGLKTGTPPDELHAQQAIAEEFVTVMRQDCPYIIGPGTTTHAIMKRLDLDGTLVGVDLIQDHRLMSSDVNEQDLKDFLQRGADFKIVVTPIGGQGYLFGRGNQPISPPIIQRAGKENIIIVATPDKIQSLHGQPLMVDTGDHTVDTMLEGYMPVVTGYRKMAVYRVIS